MLLLPKTKRNIAICLNHEMGESQSEREPHLDERKRDLSWLHSQEKQVFWKRGRTNKQNFSRSRRKHERMSRRKNSLGGFAESWFNCKSGQT